MVVYVTPEPRKTRPFSSRQAVSSGTRLRSTIAAGRRRPKFISTMRSVPPLSGTASGCSALIASASSSECGSSTSMAVRLLYPRGDRTDASEQRPGAEDQVLVGGSLPWRVAEAAHAWNKQHAGGNVTREDGGVMPGTARQLRGPTSELRAYRPERGHERLIHRRRRHRREELDVDPTALFCANAFEPGRERPDRLPDHPLVEVAHFERELSTTWDDVDTAGVKTHRPDVGHRLGVDALHEVPQLSRGARGGAPCIMAQPEGGRPRVVLGSLDLDPLAVDADDAGHHREVDPVRFHAWALLDVELDEGPDRISVLLRLQHPVEVAARRSQHLADRDPLPIESIAESLDVELAGKCQAADQARLEAYALLVRKTDDLQLFGQWIAGLGEGAQHFEGGDRSIGAIEAAA